MANPTAPPPFNPMYPSLTEFQQDPATNPAFHPAYAGAPMTNPAFHPAYAGVPMTNPAAYGGIHMTNPAAYGGIHMANPAVNPVYGGVPVANQAFTPAYAGVPMVSTPVSPTFVGVTPLVNPFINPALVNVPMANPAAAFVGNPAVHPAYSHAHMTNPTVHPAHRQVSMTSPAVNPTHAHAGIPTSNPAVTPPQSGIPVNKPPVETSSLTQQQNQEEKKPTVPARGLMAPYGYNIMDVFQEGNIIQLIPHGESAPIKVSGSHIKPNGDYLHPENTFFRVKIPYDGAVQLRSYNKPKCHIAIDSLGNIKGDGKETGDRSCQFKIHLKDSENKQYVCLETLRETYKGWFLSMKDDGKMVGPDDKDAQFRVRVEQWVTPRKTVLKAFGRPSIANKLKDGAIIQLKGKSSNKYVHIDRKGVVDEVIGGDDNLTYFILIDRGMGVVSLHSYKHGGHRIRISNGVLEGKGDPDPPADFYLKETRDGAVSLESVTCPGTYVSVGKGSTKSTTFAVYHVEIEKHGKQESVKTAPITV